MLSGRSAGVPGDGDLLRAGDQPDHAAAAGLDHLGADMASGSAALRDADRVHEMSAGL